MKGYNNILCATDFSDFCRSAAEHATDLARQYSAQLTLLHVVEYFPEDRSNVAIAPEDVDPAAYRKQQAHTSLVEFAKHLDYDKVVQEIRFTTHSAKHEIIHFAEEQNIDLIVVASHGRHGLSALVGSTANGLVNGAPCNVLVVRALV